MDILRRAEGVRWVSEPDRGQSHALNKALAMSGGDIIGWVNSDDAYADRRAVAEAVRTFEEHPEVGAVYGHTALVNSSNLVLQLWWSPSYWPWLLPRMTPFAQPAVFLRRSMLPEPFVREDLHYVMDRDLWLRLHRSGVAFHRMDIVAGVDRQQPDRKVLSAAYLREAEDYSVNGLGHPLPRVPAKALKVAFRWCGGIDALRLSTSIESAFPLRFDGVKALVVRQLMTPRRKMPR